MSVDGNKPGPLTWVFDNEALGQLIEAVISAQEVIFDLETTGLSPYAVEGGHQNGGVGARVVLASFTLPQATAEGDWDGIDATTWILPLSHPDSPWRGNWKAILLRVLSAGVEAKKPMSNHNIKFDAKYEYAQIGLDISDRISWDTQDAGRILDENGSNKLKDVAPRTFGIDRWDEGFSFESPGAAERVPLFQLGEYAARDTYWTWRLGRHQKEQMFLEGDEQPFGGEDYENARLGKFALWVTMPTVASLTKIEQRGFRLDVPWCEETLAEAEQISREGLEQMADRYGLDRQSASAAPTSHWFKKFTEIAVEKGDLRITAMTGKGNPQWSKGVLGRQARMDDEGVAALILRQRKYTKRAEFLRSWLEFVTPEGFIHAQYNTGMSTGRLSSSSPNLQQVTKSLRPAFIPRDGYYVADFDFSQIEMRAAAHISECVPMIEAFRAGEDLHRLLATWVIEAREHRHVTTAEVTPQERQGAKAGNFGLLFGLGAFGFREYAEDNYGVVMTLDEATQLRQIYFDRWKGLREWHQKTMAIAHRDGQVVSPIGRVRRLPEIYNFNDKLVAAAERIAINSPVQGFASDMMQIALASIQGVLHSSSGLPAIKGAYPIGTVHDSAVVELPVNRWQEIAGAVKERMENLHPVLERLGCQLKVPIVADVTVGTRWSLSDVSG
jgi:DNA polymerase I-like protein with 3'-5' exonuclease and polymerase domains